MQTPADDVMRKLSLDNLSDDPRLCLNDPRMLGLPAPSATSGAGASRARGLQVSIKRSRDLCRTLWPRVNPL
jgi:hypothetical protein